MLEYPLQGLNGLAAGVAAGLAGSSPAAVVASPEASLEEIAGLPAAMAAGAAHRDPPPAVEVLVFGRQQVLHTRDQLGRAEGLFEAPGPAEHVGPRCSRTPRATSSRPSRRRRHAPLQRPRDQPRAQSRRAARGRRRDVPRRAGAMDEAERAAFAAGGLPALAPLASRERSTTGHLFRGVA